MGRTALNGAKWTGKKAVKLAGAGVGATIGTLGGLVAGGMASALTGEDKVASGMLAGAGIGAATGTFWANAGLEKLNGLADSVEDYRLQNDSAYRNSQILRQNDDYKDASNEDKEWMSNLINNNDTSFSNEDISKAYSLHNAGYDDDIILAQKSGFKDDKGNYKYDKIQKIEDRYITDDDKNEARDKIAHERAEQLKDAKEQLAALYATKRKTTDPDQLKHLNEEIADAKVKAKRNDPNKISDYDTIEEARKVRADKIDKE